MAEMLPTVDLFIGVDRNAVFVGPGTSTFDWSDFDTGGLHCADLGIDYNTATAADAEITNSNADLTVYFQSADYATAGDYFYHLYVTITSSSKTLDVAGTGIIRVRARP